MKNTQIQETLYYITIRFYLGTKRRHFRMSDSVVKDLYLK